MRKFFVVLGMGTCLALGVVRQRVGLILLGYRVEAMSSIRDELLDQHRMLHYNVLALRSPVILDGRLARRDIQLTPPKAVEVLAPPRGSHPLEPVWGGLHSMEAPWWRQALRLGARWFGAGQQAIAEPAVEDR